MTKPALAYVVPAYNATATLAQTLRCLITQTQPAWEAVVVDDGSDDDPGAVVRAMSDPRIRVVRQANAGLAGARNTGWLSTTAEAVCFLDADDLVAPTHAEHLLERLHDNDAAACAARMLGPDGEDLDWISTPGWHDLTPERMLEANPLCVGAVVVARRALARLNLPSPPFDATMRVAEDWDLWLRMTVAGSRWAPIVASPLFMYRLRPGSLYGNVRMMWEAGLALIERSGRRSPAARDAARRWTVRCLARAVVRGDRALIAEHMAALHTLEERDVGVLVGALRWGFCREHCVPPARAGAWAGLWQEQVRQQLSDQPVVQQVLQRLTWSEDRWGRVARGAASRIGPGQTLVVCGLGQNGRNLLAALDGHRLCIAVMDDHPSARAAYPKVRMADLTSRHVVIVTPEDRGGLLARLREAGVRNILLPEELINADETCPNRAHGVAA